MRTRWLFVAACLISAGCKTKTLADPNDPNDVPVVDAVVIQNRLKGAADTLFERRSRGEISEAEYRKYVTRAATEILDTVKVEAITPADAWRYGEVCIAARRWPIAEKVLAVAVKAAQTDDRRVNDSLRLARVLCEQGRVAEAIPLAQSVFKAPPTEKAPILTAVLLEIVPAGRAKGQDPQLAKLLEGAISQAQQTVVDPATDAGRAFISARPYHTNNAWQTVVGLYESGGRRAEARAAAKRASAALSGQAKV